MQPTKLELTFNKKLKSLKLETVMIRIRSKRFPLKTVKVVCTWSRTFQSDKKNDNAYVLNLPEGFGISPIFNVEDLIA